MGCHSYLKVVYEGDSRGDDGGTHSSSRIVRVVAVVRAGEHLVVIIHYSYKTKNVLEHLIRWLHIVKLVPEDHI